MIVRKIVIPKAGEDARVEEVLHDDAPFETLIRDEEDRDLQHDDRDDGSPDDTPGSESRSRAGDVDHSGFGAHDSPVVTGSAGVWRRP
jgi:hypothetical protein